MAQDPHQELLSATTSLTPVWRSDVSRNIPATDIVSYAFGKRHDRSQEKPIFVSTADSSSSFLTYDQVYDIVVKLCKGWQTTGLKPGDCVTLCCPNNILYPPIWFSVIGSGGIASGANPSLTTSELEHHFKITQTKWIVGHREHASDLLKAAAKCQIDAQQIFLFDDDLKDFKFPLDASSTDRSNSISLSTDNNQEDGNAVAIAAADCVDLNSLLTYGKELWKSHNDLLKPAVYATTSGTTGLPKAAVLPHQYLVSQALMLENEYKSRANPIQLIALPIFHTFASNCALVLPLRLGITTYISPRFKAGDFVEKISRFSITDAPVVPPIISTLVQQGKKDGQKFTNKLHSLRRLICAGSPMKQGVQKDLYQFLHPDCRVSQCWGTTETGWVTLTPGCELDESGSVGQLTMNVELKLVDEKDSVIVEEGRQGEALIRTTSLFLGYLHNPTANKSAFDQEGFYRTGDRAYFENRKVFIEGRIKDILKVKAFQVSPEELEDKIQKHPSVIDCVVVGYDIADAAGLDLTHPRAYVVVSQNSGTTAQDIYDWVASQTAHYKHLTGGVIFIDNIPRNASGKILRRILQARDDQQ